MSASSEMLCVFVCPETCAHPLVLIIIIIIRGTFLANMNIIIIAWVYCDTFEAYT